MDDPRLPDGAGPQAADAARGASPEAAGETGAAHLKTAEAAPAWLDEQEMTAWLAFLEVSHLLDRAIEQQLRKDAGLSHAQYEVLTRLSSAEGGQLRMSELADNVIVSRSGLTYQVTQLEKAGLVRRERCPGDDRGVFAVLTASGRAVLERAAPGHVQVVRHYLIDALAPAQRTALTDGLSCARARLRAGARPDDQAGASTGNPSAAAASPSSLS